MKKVANINGSNMLLTADHGFLFQQDDVDISDMPSYFQGQTNGHLRTSASLSEGASLQARM